MISNNVCFTQKELTPNFAPKSFYLVDSLDLNLVSDEDLNFIDSCLEVYHNEQVDTLKIIALLGIIDNIWNQEVWPKYNKYLLNKLLVTVTSCSGIAELQFMKMNIAVAINNEGFYYRSIGNIPLALKYYHQSLKLLEEMNDTLSMTYLYNNNGVIYQHQRTFDKALEFHFKALNMNEQLLDSGAMAHSYNNIGVIYDMQDILALSKYYYQKGLVCYLSSGDIRGFSRVYYNLASIYEQMDSLKLSETFFYKSLDGYQVINEQEGIALTCGGLGRLYIKLGDLAKARMFAQKGLIIAQTLGHPELIRNTATVLYFIEQKSGNWKEALEMRNLEIKMRDSVINETGIQAAADELAKHEYEKQQVIKDVEHRAEIEKQQSLSEVEKKRQNTVLVAVSGGFFLVVLFSIFLSNRIRETRKQKRIIEDQKHEVEEKNKEILDSIRYAKRIQNAILPSMDAMQSALKKGFVLYKPKDVVAGDFYWMEEINGKVYFAAADCTGHGVPGAMVSVVCSNALSKALLEENSKSTGELLDKTRYIVINQLAKSGEEMKDGMDISVCAVDFEKMELQWSGANNPLWVLREKELVEYKADKQPVGAHSQMKPFSTTTISLQTGDKIYLFTDGFQDQFGGEKGKKFKAAKLKEKLISMHAIPIDSQMQMLEIEFENWRNNIEQIDDVCIIGVEI